MGEGSYVDVGGIATYHEVAGSGDPLLLLHGGLCSAEMCAPVADALATRFRVFAPERRGHGRTTDGEAAFTYEAMAEETLAFMDAVGLSSAEVVGFSDGANIGLLLGVHHPARVRRLVSISGNYRSEGSEAPSGQPERGEMSGLIADLAATYARLSPDGPDHLAHVMPRLLSMWQSWEGLTVQELQSLRVPTLVVAADADAISLEHTLEMYRALPVAQLGVVPNTSHNLVNERPQIVADLILEFLSSA